MPRRKPTIPPETTGDGASGDAGQTSAQPVSEGLPEAGSLRSSEPAPTAFDLFVERGLHAIYDGVLAEPIPDELLRLIEDDRRKE